MLLLGKLLALIVLIQSHAAATTEQHDRRCDHWVSAQGTPKGVLVVSHGLNLLSAKMDEMAAEFAAHGYEVLIPAFRGHCGENNNYLNVTPDQWLADARDIYAQAASKAQAKKLPIHLVAYSFSTLIFDSLAQELPFQKRIFFAPPMATHYWFRPLLFLAKLFPDFSLMSRNLPEYRANERSNFRSLLALNYFKDKWENSPKLATPALAWIDPEDELVSASGLAKMKFLKLLFLSNRETTLKKTYHHLIIDKAALGEQEWERVMKTSMSFLGN